MKIKLVLCAAACAASIIIGGLASAETNDNPILGDVNMDGSLDFFDIQPFIGVLSTEQFHFEADIDGNGVVNFLDIQPFVDLLASDGFPDSAPINETPEFPEIIGLNAPAERFAGSRVEVSWNLPEGGAFVTLARLGDPVDIRFNTFFSTGSNAFGVGSGILDVPFELDTFEIRMIRGDEILATRPLDVVSPRLRSVDSGPAGGTIDVDWVGPLRNGSFVTIASPEDPFDVRENTFFSAVGISTGVGSGELATPWALGEYEIRLISGDQILSCKPYTVTGTDLSAAASGFAGGDVVVDWAGPRRTGAFVTIARPDDPFDIRENTFFSVPAVSTREGSGNLSIPWALGDYEIRMIQDDNILAAIPFTVDSTILTAPASGSPGETIEVDWQGPTRSGSFVTIASPEDPFDVREPTFFSVPGISTGTGTGSLVLPDVPGTYEIRMIQGSNIVGTAQIQVQ